MIDLNKYYISKKYEAPSGSYPTVGGFVPPATSGDAGKFLRSDGAWSDTSQNYEILNSSQALTSNRAYGINTISGGYALTLPSNPSIGDTIELFDIYGSWDINPATVQNGGNNIAGSFANLIVNVRYGLIKLIYTGPSYGWRIVPLPKNSISGSYQNGAAQLTHFAVLGDGQDGSLEAENKLAQLIPSYNPEYIIHVGDINQSVSSSTTYPDAVSRFENRFLANWSGTNYLDKIYLAPGNHDLDVEYGDYIIAKLPATSGAIGIEKLNQRLYCYDVRKGPAHFFVMNAGNTFIGNNTYAISDSLMQFSEQLADIVPKIQNSTAPWKILVIHKPPRTLDPVHQPGATSLFNQIDFNGLGIDVALHGHGHTYEVWKFDDPSSYPVGISNFTATGTHFIVNGLGGADIRGQGTAPNGALKSVYYETEAFMNVYVDPTGFRYDLVTTGNQIVDSQAFSKPSTDLNLNLDYYNAQAMLGATSSGDGREGFVTKPVAGDNKNFLRGDGAWSDPTISKIQYIENSNNITLDVSNYSTFVVNLTESATFTYSGFENGKSINVYLVANHTGHLPHTFPPNTVFAELGDENIIYSFEGYTTRILLQNIGAFVINFSSISKNVILPNNNGYYYGNNAFYTIGIDLLDLFSDINILDTFLNNLNS